MSNIGNFKRVGREVVYKGKILEFCQDEIQTSKGHHVTWDFLNHKGAAAIVPVMDDGKILMVKQWRNVVNRVSLEIPAGAKDTVEEPTLECATRELEEETGYKPGRMERIYMPLVTEPMKKQLHLVKSMASVKYIQITMRCLQIRK